VRPVDPTPLSLEFDTDHAPTLRVVVSGEIDFASAPSMQARVIGACERERSNKLILDLTAVEFMDSSGLRVLLHLQRELSSDHGALVLLGPTEEVRKILKLTGLDQHLALAGSLEQAQSTLAELLQAAAEQDPSGANPSAENASDGNAMHEGDTGARP
jgi:anti-sigma B factor antagonist